MFAICALLACAGLAEANAYRGAASDEGRAAGNAGLAAAPPPGRPAPASLASGRGTAVESAEWSTPAHRARREVVYLDETVEDDQTLLAGLGAHVDVVRLDRGRDGVRQIARELTRRGPVAAIHVIAHGDQAALRLGSGTLTPASMRTEHAEALAAIRRSLTGGADVLIYGCRFGRGASGRHALALLAELTGADVAASDDPTGAGALGGDWDLEVTTGRIEASAVVTARARAEWRGLLDSATVTTTADVLDGDADTSSLAALVATPGADGLISLREAIVAANTSAGADTIDLPAGTYTLALAGVDEDAAATGDLDVTDALTLAGAGAATTIIDGGGLDRVIDVTATGSLSLDDVTVQGGDARAAAAPDGGGIRSLGTLKLTRVVVSGNFANNGGGLSHSTASTLTLTDVEISLNTATLDGGGFYAATPATGGTFSRVLFDTNSAGNQGGGAYLSGNSNSPSFTNTTFSGNGATDDGGGIYHTGSVLSLMNVTLTGNSSGTDGGGIYVNNGPRTTNVTNTILAGNTAPANPEMRGTIDSGTNNVIGDTTGLAALAANGGFTRTHAIDATSPAYDGGTNTGAPTVDQRGYIRFDGTTDVGAYELGGGLPITARETIDDDADGQIDHIKITTDQALNDDFSDLTVTVSGYTVTGYVTEIGAGGLNDDVFYVQLAESGTPDTGVRPTVLVTANTQLTDFGGTIVVAPDPPPDSKILFQTDRDGNNEIYTMDADGTNPTRLTNDAGNDLTPVQSPDGTRIAFPSDRNGNYEIYVMDADGSNPTRLTNDAALDRAPAWSPDGSKIAFYSDRDGNSEIYVMDADGSNQTRITNDAAVDRGAGWSPDGTKIVFWSDRDGNAEIYVMDADGSNPINLTNDAAVDTQPTWSPDGSRIAFWSDRDGNAEIYVMDADGSNPTRLTSDAAPDRAPAWSPDGSQITFRSDRDGNGEIYVMDADGSNQTRLTNNTALDNTPSWWQDPNTLATDSAPPVLLAAPSTRPDGSYVFQVAGHQVDFVFSEVLSGAPSEAQLETAWGFGGGATDGDNLPSMGGGVTPFTLATTTSVNDTIRVTFNAGNAANADLLLVGTHTVQVSDGTNITDLAGNPAATAPAAVPITGTGSAAPLIAVRETIDSDADGQIDHIRITADQPLNDNFGDLTMTVSGYTVTGYVTEIGAGGANDTVFYVQLTESGTPDTGVKPTVLVIANTLLTDFGGVDPILPDPPPGSKIAFRSDRDGNAEIYAMDADGSNQTNLTNNAAGDEWPAWSPDGSQIAFDSVRDGNFEIYVMDADGSNQTRITNNGAADAQPTWSPDGTKIAFRSDRDGNYEIYVMDADGSNQINLTNDAASDHRPSWSPDGSKIAFYTDRDGNTEIYVMDADGSNPINLTNNAAADLAPAWSPDGSQIVFQSGRDGNAEIFVMDADGSNQVNLTNNAAVDAAPAWSGDGSQIAFRSDRDGNSEIYAMDADGTNQVNLTNDAGPDWAPSWWQDVSTQAVDSAPPVLLAATSNQFNGTQVFQLAGESVDFVFSETLSGLPSEAQLEAAWSFGGGATDGDNLPSIGGGTDPFALATSTTLNDAIRVTFSAGNTANGNLLLVGTHTVQVAVGTSITDLAGNPAATAAAAVPITGIPAPLITARETIDSDADGQIDHIKVTTDQLLNDNFGDLTVTVSGYTVTGYVTEIGAGGANDAVFYVQLTESGSADTGVRPTVLVTANTLLTEFGGSNSLAPDSPPDSKIAFYTDRDGNREIYVMDADGSNPTRLTNDAASDESPAWSPDGSQIAFDSLRDGNREIYVMDADGSNQTNLTNDAAYDSAPAWSPDGSKIAFHTNRDGNQEIYVMDADGSNPTRLTNDPGFDTFPSWSPDGSKIAFRSSRDGNNEIYVMDADGSNPINLTNDAAADDYPAWSPDGSQIAFHTDRDGNLEIYVMNADGSNPTRLVGSALTDRQPTWSPDGSQIAFASIRDGNWEVYKMDADGSNQTNLTTDAATDYDPSWGAASFLATDSAPPVLLSAPSNQVNGTNVFQVAGEQVDLVFSETLSGLPSEAQLEAAWSFASGATDGDNLPSTGGGANPFSLVTTTSVNDTIRVTFNAGNTANTNPLLVGTHTVQVSAGTNLTDIAGNTASTAAAAVPITGAATQVELVSFGAESLDGAVQLSWQTGSELSNLGFHLYRSASPEGPWQRITAALIPGLGSSAVGATYGYTDTGLRNGQAYFYLLEDVETTGAAKRHGPVSATPAASDEDSEPDPDDPTQDAASWIRYGDPEASALRVLSRGQGQVVLELTTGGFYALPQPDGTVLLSVPGFDSLDSPGEPDLPVRRAWIDAVAGRQVAIGSVRVRRVETFDSLRPADAGVREAQVFSDGTVRAGRRAAPPRFRGGEGLFPEAPAALLDTGFQGETKKALVELAPLRWDAVSGQLLLARRLEVSVSFAGREPAEHSLGGSRGRQEPTRGKRGKPVDETRVLAFLSAPAAGPYGVAFEDVLPGQRKALRSSALRLSRRGRDVPFHVAPDPSRFGPGSILFFLSQGPADNPDATQAVYALEAGVAGTTMGTLDARPSGPALDAGRVRRNYETDRLYLATLLDAPDPWLWDVVIAPRAKGYPFSLDRLVSGSTGRLEVHLVGGTDTPEDPDHHVAVSLNGVPVADVRWDGKQPFSIDAEVPAGVLLEGVNSLQIHAVGDTGASVSGVYLDRFAVAYARALVADTGILEARFDTTGQALLSGLTADPLLLDTTDPNAPLWITGAQSTGTALALRAEAGRRLLAASRAAVGRPAVRLAANVAALRDTGTPYDYVAIGPRDFLQAAAPLFQWRRDQGLRVLEVPLEDLYDAFSGGEPHTAAIHDFLSFAFHDWPAPPRYVLLLGDASYDGKGRLGFPDRNHVPPFMIRTPYMRTVSDAAYAAVNGDDRLPDLALGRLPAATAEEAQRLAAKVVSWERDGYSFADATAVLVADNADAAGDFPRDAEEIAQTLLAGRDVEILRLDQLGAATRATIRGAFDRGTGVVSYFGHGAFALWASENVFNSRDVATLAPQPQQPLLLTMNCLNGYILHPIVDSLAEAFVKAEGKGAVAAFSPASLSIHSSARRYHDALLGEVLSGRHARLGDALLAAQARYAAMGALPDLLDSYLLLADPATSLR